MAIVNLVPYYSGQSGQLITRWKLVCNETLAQVTAADFLNTKNLMGYTVGPLDIFDCFYNYTGSINQPGVGTYVELIPTITHFQNLTVITLGQVSFSDTNAVIIPSTTHTQAGATPITTNMVSATPANAGDAVILPPALGGQQINVQDASATLAMQVYASGTDTINGTAGSTGVSQAAATDTIYTCFVTGKWVSK